MLVHASLRLTSGFELKNEGSTQRRVIRICSQLDCGPYSYAYFGNINAH